ncbi:MAG: sulfite exporter TauE/SafE family protein [Thiohalophilus sp.]|uniref:sulfite exporter TauE/SafE family protein n=1 Tax=Thiohalophilus sp. TaxID=3028392 RepID=UPI00286FB1F7|nr:sulfite exporter TauE/SafE family protein [Thiohalophilus sp.]MDR9437521.1 sulfite exporter TauE/SafE family protein [Thiohalophilus sp.]
MEIGLLYLLLGMFAGVAAGLLGIGGGLIIVPVLVFIFQQQQFSSEVIVHLAVGTSLATIVLTSISSVRSHHQHGAVLWSVFVRMAPAIVLGALLGSVIADWMPTRVLKWVFAIFELTVATQMILAYRPNPNRVLPNWPGLSLAGTLIGAVSAVVGIGGGTMTVPFLVWCNVAMRKAVATAAACGLPIAVAGATGFIINGWNEPGLPAWSSGYVYWPAFIGIVATSVLFAPLGARLAHRLPAAQLKRIFALLLYALGIRMLLG